jgi:hypothetical protein
MFRKGEEEKRERGEIQTSPLLLFFPFSSSIFSRILP